MAKKPSKKQIEQMRAAAIAAVVAEITGEKKSGIAAGALSRGGHRESWKMAGRAERLGIGPFEKAFTRKV